MSLGHDNLVTLSPYWIDRCRELGALIVDNYIGGRCNGSRAFSMGGAELDAEVQANARMGEVAFCIWAGFDPDTAMSWTGLPDHGHDVLFRGLLIDVKTIEHFKQYLIWPVTKNSIYLTKRFQVLVLAKADPPQFEIARWIDKAGFYCERRIADGVPGLIDGTWHMLERDLWTIEQFCEFTAHQARRREVAA
jgi:hypothetical protein